MRRRKQKEMGIDLPRNACGSRMATLWYTALTPQDEWHSCSGRHSRKLARKTEKNEEGMRRAIRPPEFLCELFSASTFPPFPISREKENPKCGFVRKRNHAGAISRVCTRNCMEWAASPAFPLLQARGERGRARMPDRCQDSGRKWDW